MKKTYTPTLLACFITSLFIFSACVPNETCTPTEGQNSQCQPKDSDDQNDKVPTPPTPGTDVPPGKETDKAGSFDRPWQNKNTSIVIDAYEGNRIDWDEMSKDRKMLGVIHRSSIGFRKDSLYESRKKIALERGYLWGAYHLGRRGSTIEQADFFLSIVENEPDTLMILDLEDTASNNFMSIEEAIVFMEHVFKKTGKIPVVYANHKTTILLNSKVKNHPLFQKAKFWYARFKEKITDFPSGVWKNYFLWQFSSEINCSPSVTCLYRVPGTSHDMDVNVFNGPEGDLKSQWNNDPQ
jgi:lysozyme